MNKKEFVDFLNNKLYFLVEGAKNKEIKQYEDVIDNYVNMGQTEEASVSSLGDPEDLVKAIYLSHGLDYKKIYNGKTSKNDIKNSFHNFYQILTGNDKKKAKNAILYLVYLILLVILLKVVFIVVRDQGSQFLSELITNNLASKVYYITFEAGYIITALIVFFKSFAKKFKNI